MEKNSKASKKRIALIGPESTAKTTLAEQLAQRYDTVFVPEYSREYIINLERDYTLEDIARISKIQLEQEKLALKRATNYLFVDTELIVAKIWCEDVFKTCPEWIIKGIAKYPYDLYLLTSPDIPWTQDLVRENGKRREYFFDLYQQELKSRNFPYTIIIGSNKERLKNAIKAIDGFFLK